MKIKLSNLEKGFLGLVALAPLPHFMLGNNYGYLLGHFSLLLGAFSTITWMLYRVYLKVEELNANVEATKLSQLKVEEVLSETKIEIPLKSQAVIESIPRLLSAIKMEKDVTLFDWIIERSTRETQALNLMKAHDAIIAAVSDIKINTHVKPHKA